MMKKSLPVGVAAVALVGMALVGLWRLRSGAPSVTRSVVWTLLPHPTPKGNSVRFNPLEAVAFSPDGQTLASGGREGTLRLWDVRTGMVRRVIPGRSGAIYSVAFSPDGKTVANGSAATANLWDVASGRLLRRLRIAQGYPSFEFYAVAFSPDGKTLATGSGGNSGKPFQVKLWNAASGKLLRTLNGHRGQVRSLGFAPNGKTLVSGGYDGVIRVWDARTGKALKRWKGTGGFYSVVFSPDGKSVASASTDRLVELRNASSGVVTSSFVGHVGVIRSLAFFGDGKTLIGGGEDGKVTVWDVAMGQIGRVFDTQTGTSQSAPVPLPPPGASPLPIGGRMMSVTSVAASPDGSVVASASFDGSLQMWRFH